MEQETVFAKIVRGEAPADIVYQDELVTAFWDIGKTCAGSYLDRAEPVDSDSQRRDAGG